MFKIVKNIKIPKTMTSILKNLKIGDMFTASINKKHSIYSIANFIGIKVTIKKDNDIIKIWRIK